MEKKRKYIKEGASLSEAFNSIDEQLVKLNELSISKDILDEFEYNLENLKTFFERVNKFIEQQNKINSDIYTQLNK